MITSIGEILVDQFITENGASNALGGAPFNVAATIKRSGGHASFVGAVGNDKLGEFLLSKASSLGLDNLYIPKLEQYNTTIAKVTLTNGERDFKFVRDNGADYHIEYPLPKFVEESNIVHIGSLMLSEQEGREFALKTIKYLQKHDILISFDINYREDIFKGQDNIKDIFKAIIEQVDILKISDEEIDIFGHDYIYGLKDKLICLSLGSKGSMYKYNDLQGIVPTKKVKPVDTTGAGDAFFGAVLSQIDGYKLNELTKDHLDKAFAFANAVGALTTLGKGAIDPIPDKATTIKFMNN